MYGPNTILRCVLKNKLRGVPRGMLSSTKDFVFFKGDEIFPQSLSDSQDHFGA